MKSQVKWIPIKTKPPMYHKLWVATRDGKVHLSERIGDTYFGSERLNFEGLGFLDLAVYYKHACNEVTHWAKYVKPQNPDAPK